MLIGFLTIWLITAFGLWVVTQLVPGVRAQSAGALWIAALVLGLVNAFVRPILWFLTFPLTLLTFGLFAIVINALMIWMVGGMVRDFEVDGFGSAFLAALVMALLGVVGIVLLQWLMIGEISWIMRPMSPGMYI